MHRNCLMLFVRSPEAEGVKSRLAATIGEKRARQLYRRFVPDLLDSLHTENYRLRLLFSPPDHRDAVREWLGDGVSCEPQTGEDLGERMKDAFVRCFADGSEAAILIGSDIPDMPEVFIDRGFASLKENDCVIGPSLDGGYYLIGFNADTFLPEAFTGISWSTDSVQKTTVSILEKRGLSIAVLPQWRDIDGYADLIALVERNRYTAFARSRTIRYVLSHHLAPF
jgi:rSAM/selenodomain-associated transferase 1